MQNGCYTVCRFARSTELVAALINCKPCPHICCRTDLVSAVIKRKLNVLYADNSQIDLDLTGEVIFPNLKFDLGQVDFGSVLNDSTARVPVTATNTSKVAAVFQWVFVEGQGGPELGEAGNLQCVSADRWSLHVAVKRHSIQELVTFCHQGSGQAQ